MTKQPTELSVGMKKSCPHLAYICIQNILFQISWKKFLNDKKIRIISSLIAVCQKEVSTQ